MCFVNDFTHKSLNIFCHAFRKVDKSMFSLFEKIKELCQKRGISINSLEETLGYSRNTIYSMKSKKPNAERLQESQITSTCPLTTSWDAQIIQI